MNIGDIRTQKVTSACMSVCMYVYRDTCGVKMIKESC